MKCLILIRGLPGSGKTTLSWMIAPYEFFEADQFFETDDGYVLDQTRIKEAHAWCLDSVRRAMEVYEDEKQIVVSNTFTQLWEMQPYIDMASEHGYTVQVIECKGNFGSIHNVPQEAIERMRERWEEYRA